MSRFIAQVRRSFSSNMAQHTNRLANEKSPYLLQHAHNPVDWHPWGLEAIEAARSSNRLIFLSVGYSTCHWCHVMERESFEHGPTAEIMNRCFVNIKVDREERPDVDRIYMTYVQLTTGGGGWPMSVWISPDELRPIVGGTYFPREPRYGRPGFGQICEQIASQWLSNPDELKEQTDQIMQIMNAAADTKSQTQVSSITEVSDAPEQCFDRLQSRFDPVWGGFGRAPKFPQAVNFDFLLAMHIMTDSDERREKISAILGTTLDRMCRGGLYDHVGYAFARYSTDKSWHVPHFEKMLYDQAQLASVYAKMSAVQENPTTLRIARETLDYVMRDLSHPSGGFFCGEDADSLPLSGGTEKKEGAFYVWSDTELRSLLAKEKSEGLPSDVSVYDIFAKHYNVKANGNLTASQDPHNEMTGQNVLIVLGSLAETANHFECNSAVIECALEHARTLCLNARTSKRSRPHLDTKILTAWNALMITGFCHYASIADETKYLERALQAAEFIRQNLWNGKQLYRSCYAATAQGEISQLATPIQAFSDDYVFLIRACLDLYTSSGDYQWIQFAIELQRILDDRFYDRENESGYFMADGSDETLILRLKEDQDGAEPAASTVAVSNLMRLAALLHSKEYKGAFPAFSGHEKT